MEELTHAAKVENPQGYLVGHIDAFTGVSSGGIGFVPMPFLDRCMLSSMFCLTTAILVESPYSDS